MYGISNRTKFLTVKNNQGFEGQELMVQTEFPHIVGRVVRFGCTESAEQRRQDWIAKRGEDAQVVQSMDYRIYVELVGTLQDVHREKIESAKRMSVREYSDSVLCSMLSELEENLSDGQRIAYSWQHAIVPDDFFKNYRKAKKEERLAEEKAGN